MRWILLILSDVIVCFQLFASIPYWGMIMSNPTMETKALPRLARSLPKPDWYRYNLLCVQSKSRHISKALNKTLYFKLEWLSQNLLGSSFSQVNPFRCSIAIVSFFHRPVISIRVLWKIRSMKMPGNAVHFRSKVFWYIGIGSVARFLKNSNL